MRKNSGRYALNHILASQAQAALYSLGTLCRSPLASGMTIAVIAVVLCLPTCLTVLLQNIKALTNNWDKGIQITLFLDTNLQAAEVSDLIGQLELQPGIEKINYISPDTGLSQLEMQAGFTGLTEQLAMNPLPPVVEVFPTPNYYNPELFAALLADLKRLPGVQTAQYDLQWLERLQAMIQLTQRALLLLTILFISTVLFVVANTIRITTQARRKEIEVYKLVGATNRFIRRSFLYSGLFYGLFGGIVAWVLVVILLGRLQSSVQHLTLLYQSSFSFKGLGLHDTMILITASATLGLIAAYFSVNRHIRAIEPS